MPRSVGISIIQLGFLILTLACGISGARLSNDQTPQKVNQLIEYGLTLAERSLDASRREDEYRDTGREEEIYRVRDDKFNAELDWRATIWALQRQLEPTDTDPLAAHDFLDAPGPLHAALEDLHARVNSRLPLVLRFALAALFMIATLLTRPVCRRRFGAPAQSPPEADPGAV